MRGSAARRPRSKSSFSDASVRAERSAGRGGCKSGLQPDPNHRGQYMWVQVDLGCPSGGGSAPIGLPVPIITINFGADLSGMTDAMRAKLKLNISAAIDASAGGTSGSIQVVFQRCTGPGGAVCWCQYELQPDPNVPGEYVWVQVDTGCP